MNGDGRDVADALHVPDLGKQFFLAEYMVGILCEECEKVEFLRGEILLFAVDPYSSRGLVDLEIPDLNNIVGLLAGADQSLVAGHVRLHARDKFARAEGLCDIVIRTKAETADLVDIVLLGGDHEDRHISVLADPFAHFKSVHARKHQVQDDQVKLLLERSLQALVAPVLYLDFKSAQLQIILFQISDRHFIFNDQYFAHIVPPLQVLRPLLYSRPDSHSHGICGSQSACRFPRLHGL